MKKADIVFGVVGVIIGLYVIVRGMFYPADVVMNVGPAFFPSIIAWLFVLFSSILLLQAFTGKSQGEYDPIIPGTPETRRLISSLCAMILYCLCLKPLGFILTTIIFIAFIMALMGNRNRYQFLLVPIAITAGVFAVFEMVLNLSLPAGILSFLF